MASLRSGGENVTALVAGSLHVVGGLLEVLETTSSMFEIPINRLNWFIAFPWPRCRVSIRNLHIVFRGRNAVQKNSLFELDSFQFSPVISKRSTTLRASNRKARRRAATISKPVGPHTSAVFPPTNSRKRHRAPELLLVLGTLRGHSAHSFFIL
jgi:hypothetical protein